jgi:hypothetical protein
VKAEFYRDYHIQATAVFEAEIGSWLPRVRIFPRNPQQRLIEFTGLISDATTASEAENYAIGLGKCWLDDRATSQK